jgi:hypothetical protein
MFKTGSTFFTVSFALQLAGRHADGLICAYALLRVMNFSTRIVGVNS